jgi:hypothetical protein
MQSLVCNNQAKHKFMGLGSPMLMNCAILPSKIFTHVMIVDFMQNSTARVK